MENPQMCSRASVDDDDRISDLPESVISHVFSFLPTRTVVATSILSKRWKFRWTQVTTLNFILTKDQTSDNDDSETRVRKFVRFVNKVITHVDSQRLQKFRLQWGQGCRHDPEYISIWTSYAITRNVRELVVHLKLYKNPLPIHLPGTLFTCATLQVLRILGHFVFKVPSVVCLPKLEVLQLSCLTYESNESIPRLLSGCPVLKSFTIQRNGLDFRLNFKVSSPSLRHLVICAKIKDSLYGRKLEIDAPKLVYFFLDDVVEECSVKKLTRVNSVNLDLNVFPDANSDDDIANGLYLDQCNSIVKVIEAMDSVKFLTLEGTITKALSYATIPLSVSFKRLTELDMSVQCCHWSSVGAVLGRASELSFLGITKTGCGNSTHNLSWNDPTEVPGCLSSSLQHVSLANFEGLEDEVAMVKYMLRHGKVLESFTLKSGADPDDIKNKYRLLQLIATFPRLSHACLVQVVFFG